jgi:hypothetical protein
MRRLLPVVLLLAVAACDTTVKREEMTSVDYGPKPARWREQIRSYLGSRLTG